MDKPGQHILVVDDNMQNLQITAKVLKDNGFLISLAQDGRSALSLLKTNSPDLILLDVMMPEMDGVEVCRIIKQDNRLKEIPIIFLTAKTETDDLVEGFNAGGVDYITKPFNQDELLIRVKNHLELARSRKKIIELNQTRDKLYSIIAHDIRSPLYNISSVLEIILSGELDPGSPKFKEIISSLETMTKNTSNLLNTLLEWTKFQSGSVSLMPKTGRIRLLLQECIELLNPIAMNKGISIELDVPEYAEAFFDEVTMHTVFRNLISNAIKFTPDSGKIRLISEVKENFMVVHIRDNGIGMSAETIQKIFEQKEHYTSLGTNREKGTGFGFVVIREFIEMNNGVIEVNSEEGKGTTFSVSIPLAQP